MKIMNARLLSCAVRPRGLTGRLLWVAALAGSSASASAQIFECIDANGKLEFTQKCAPGTVRQREVAKTGAGNPYAASHPKTSYQEQEHAFRQRQFEREANERKEHAAIETAVKKCTAARTHLVSIQNARRVRGGNDPKTGEAQYLNDNERVAVTQKARDAVSTYCE